MPLISGERVARQPAAGIPVKEAHLISEPQSRERTLATRTQKFYRDESVFEQLAGGTAEFSSLMAASYSQTLGFVSLILLSLLFWIVALLMAGNLPDTPGAVVATRAMEGLAFLTTFLIALHLTARIAALFIRLFHRPAAVLVDADGVHQTGSRGREVDLKWEDIRLIQHRRSAHLVRGREKKQQIQISTRLEGHEMVASFLKFAFLLRQEIDSDWRGLLQEVRSRLSGPGFHFHCDGERSDTVYVNSTGIRHSSLDGIESEMTWDLLRESVLETQKHALKFRHTKSRTSLAIPRGTDSDEVVDEFIRWALHTAPGFSGSTE